MTSNFDGEERKPSEVSVAVMAMLAARAKLLRPSPTIAASSLWNPLRRPARELAGEATTAQPPASQPQALPAAQLPPTPEDLEATQEAALEAFPEHLRAAARSAFKDALLRIDGKAPAQASKGLVRPSPIPTNLPKRLEVEVPPFPPAGLDHPDVRTEWDTAHRARAEALFRLRPAVLKAYADAQLECDRWTAKERGRKPSGDLRHPVPRNRMEQITAELRQRHEREIARAAGVISSIETGDVVGVEYLDADADEQIPMLVLQSELDRKAALRRAKAERTPEEIQADEAKWEELVEELLADLPAPEPEMEIPNLPPLPTDRVPTKAEMAAFSNAIRRHLDYVERGEQIEAKRRRDAATKVRTAAKRDAERADPAAAEAAKEAVRRRKAAERQRRWRARVKTSKGD